MTWLLKGGHVVDPVAGLDKPADVLLADGKVRAVGPNLAEVKHADNVLDCRGQYVLPGFIDTGARVGEPGFEQRETIASATRAAAAGGFTSVCALPEGDPRPDEPAAVRFIVDEARRSGAVRLYPFGTLLKGADRTELAEAGLLQAAGAKALAELDGVPNGGLLRRALQYARMLAIPLVVRSTDATLADDGVMHEGLASTMRGVKGIPAEAEEAAIARDIIVARLAGAPLHIMAVSTAGGVEQIRQAKTRGVAVTASVGAHQLVFTDEDVRTDDPMWKVDPPFRSRADMEALREGVRDGTIDCIFSDHRPLTREEKEVEFDHAPFGVSSLETAVALVWDQLVSPGVLPLVDAVRALSANPARIFGLPGGTLAVGHPADVTIVDANAERSFERDRFHSRGRNTPLHGRLLKGLPVATFVDGRPILLDERIVVS